jgi:hypothetical protein
MLLAKTYEVRSYMGCSQGIEREVCLVSPASNRGEEMARALELGAAKLTLVLIWY